MGRGCGEGREEFELVGSSQRRSRRREKQPTEHRVRSGSGGRRVAEGAEGGAHRATGRAQWKAEGGEGGRTDKGEAQRNAMNTGDERRMDEMVHTWRRHSLESCKGMHWR